MTRRELTLEELAWESWWGGHTTHQHDRCDWMQWGPKPNTCTAVEAREKTTPTRGREFVERRNRPMSNAQNTSNEVCMWLAVRQSPSGELYMDASSIRTTLDGARQKAQIDNALGVIDPVAHFERVDIVPTGDREPVR